MPNLDGESYSDVTLSFLCLIFRLSSCLILFYLSYLVSSRVLWLSYRILSLFVVSSCYLVWRVRVVFSFLWCVLFGPFSFFSLLFSFLAFCCFLRFFAFVYFLLHSLLFDLTVAPFPRFSFIHFFFFSLFSLVVVLCWLLALLVPFVCVWLSLCLYSFFCACFCWIRFVYLFLNLFCFDIKI